MASYIKTGPVHHTTFTVANVARSAEFYTTVLGFQGVEKFGSRVVLSNGSVLLVLGPAPDPARVLTNDLFDENRVGLDHLSLTVNSRVDLEEATRVLDQRGIAHGDIVDLVEFHISVLMLRDPDNIQIELTAPRG